MTKVIILGEPKKKKPKKKIEFVKFIDCDGETLPAKSPPSKFKHIELVCTNYKFGKFDLMYAYNDDRNDGILYLGHFNDGVV